MHKSLLRALEEAIQRDPTDHEEVNTCAERLRAELESTNAKIGDELTVLYNKIVNSVDREVCFLEALIVLKDYVKNLNVWTTKYAEISIDSAGLNLRLTELATKLVECAMDRDLAHSFVQRYLQTFDVAPDLSFEDNEKYRFRRLNIRRVLSSYVKVDAPGLFSILADTLVKEELQTLALFQSVMESPLNAQFESLPLFESLLDVLERCDSSVRGCALNALCVLAPMVVRSFKKQFDRVSDIFVRLADENVEYLRLGGLLYAVSPQQFISTVRNQLATKSKSILSNMRLHPALLEGQEIEEEDTVELMKSYVSDFGKAREIDLEHLLDDYKHVFAKSEEKEHVPEPLEFYQREMLILSNELSFSEYVRHALAMEREKPDPKEVRLEIEVSHPNATMLPSDSPKQKTGEESILKNNEKLRAEVQVLESEVGHLHERIQELEVQLRDKDESFGPLREELSKLRNETIYLKEVNIALEEKLDFAKWSSTETLTEPPSDFADSLQLQQELNEVAKYHKQQIAHIHESYQREIRELESEIDSLRLEKREKSNEIVRRQLSLFQSKLKEYELLNEQLEKQIATQEESLIQLRSTQPIQIPKTAPARPLLSPNGYDSATNIHKNEDNATLNRVRKPRSTEFTVSSYTTSERQMNPSGFSFSIRRHANPTIDTSNIAVKGRGGIQNKAKLKM
ncbi:hypothetical protein KL920_000194 [Ogataea angusta]|uniref:Uncharacterized protein n=1 Tax=Pichia angusta TaxID=870730 RepID=A0AAN6I8A4_PICAN|nr:uncharacterized protein KL928_000989 [Ogataea angusta]KAG7820905.1 hypothetical protein KL928_000989 [Ogataea angusta]KAG7831859.1 hypothetical protein KL920_000194 [Ogataea angusta]